DTTPPAATPFTTEAIPRSFFVTRIMDPLRASVPAPGLEVATLALLVDRLTTAAKSLDAEGADFLKRLETNHVGFYTTEQEADDIAMDLAARIGITPDEVLRAFLSLSRGIEAATPPAERDEFLAKNGGLATADCEALYAKGFKDGHDDVYVP